MGTCRYIGWNFVPSTVQYSCGSLALIGTSCFMLWALQFSFRCPWTIVGDADRPRPCRLSASR
ncbi:hypothetical protein CI102_839 [Trichoderma harzianum]|nr:hypothetical protein CI102_839 [Trichoderma harzianum]